jgi:murein DD-endopeptidase MepM/ murein hydrolase activator NlpD
MRERGLCGLNPLEQRMSQKNNVSPAIRLRTIILFFALAFFGGADVNAAPPEKLIKITPRKDQGRTVFEIQNLTAAPVTVSLELQLQNLTPSQPVPFTTTVESHGTNSALSVIATEDTLDTSWAYTYYATWGRLAVDPDDNVLYALPFAAGKSYPVSQGYNGEFSHFGCDQYAIDWKMPIGTPVHAARDGVVVATKDDSQSGGADKKYEWDANYILVQHSDGTLGHYVHLAKGGNRVKVGDKIKTGDWIGASGNTGRSTGAHLHFAVFRARDGKHRETLPVKYRTSDAVLATLIPGVLYRAAL